jgi:hypothetical protein
VPKIPALDFNSDYDSIELAGQPASAKSLFLLGIMEQEPRSAYFDGTNTTNHILDVLEEQRPRIIMIDELDMLPKQFQHKLLNFLENGHVKVSQKTCSYDFEIKGAKVSCRA